MRRRTEPHLENDMTTETTYENVRFETEGPIATITLNRPEKLNALSTALYEELEQCYDRVAADDDIRVLVLRGAGRAFSAGNDMSLPCRTLREWHERLPEIKRRTLKLWNLPKVTIAMVHGYCLAAANELALVCDFTIASDDAVFGEPEIRHGSMAQLFLPYYVGQKKAREIILTGDHIPAVEMERFGVVNKVVPRKSLEEETYALARKMVKVPPDAIRLNKRVMNKAMEHQGLRDTADYTDEVSTILHVLMFDVKDPEGQKLQDLKYSQGVTAFLRARAARFEDNA
jgi:enoyl-CoA hydratase/carnithine racemase